MNTIKTAIAIPKTDFILVEKLRKRLHKSRSQLLVEAFREWIENRRKKDDEERYAEAYRRIPDEIVEIESFEKASLPVWSKEDW